MHKNFSRCVAIVALLCACGLAGCSLAETQAASQSPPPSLTYIESWGKKGTDPGKLDEPTCLATDFLGNVYLADAGSHFVDKFDWKGTPLLSFQDEGLKEPEAIAVDSGGAIYVIDAARGSAQIYFPNGDHYRTLKVEKHPVVENTLSVAVENSGLIHILDTQMNLVSTYTPQMRLLRHWQPAGAVPNARTRPENIAIGGDSYLYVTDRGGNRFLRFTSDGRFVSEINARPNGDRRLSDQFALFKNFIFAMDADGHMLHVWTTDGVREPDIDLGAELGQNVGAVPLLAVSPRKELLVLDGPGARVLRYRINL